MHNIIVLSALLLVLTCSCYGYIASSEDMIKELEYVIDESMPLAKKMDLENADQLSLVTRYAGVGYNLIRGSPDGEFRTGGVDPGIKITRHIFGFTYDEGKMGNYMQESMDVPDQVNFQAFASCSSSKTESVYSGSKSYQSNLAVGVEADGSYGGFEFSASAAVSQARSFTESSKKIFIDEKSICNYGRVRLINGDVTDEFYGAVNSLPVDYIERDYLLFIEDWGSHIIFETDLGTKEIIRFTSSYRDAFNFQQDAVSAGGSVGYSSFLTSGKVSVDVDTLNERVTASSKFGSELNTFTIGTMEIPLPIKMRLRPIYDALEQKYWTNIPAGATYESLSLKTKMTNLQMAFVEYPEKAGSLLQDPTISIPVTWPGGKFAFPEPAQGCPVGFVHGCRYHDTEDFNNDNQFKNANLLRGSFDSNIDMCYCVRRDDISSLFDWLPGRYCIARRGGSCPPGGRFRSGSIYWDDEDLSNNNRVSGVLPDGEYGRNTNMFYCCRGDGDVNQEILLPTTNPFVLYQYNSRGCQKVAGMTATEIYIRYDNEDIHNTDSCDDGPLNDSCGGNHRIYMCLYQ